MRRSEGRIAYCTVPKIGGTFNFYRNLRQSLVGSGWEVVAPVVGQRVNSLWDLAYPSDGAIPVAAQEHDVKRASMALVEWCERERIDILIPMSVQAAVSAIPHLPSSVRPIMRCSNITRHAYDIVAVHLDRVRRVVATSQRQYDDLLRRRNVPTDKLVLIPHGIDTAKFELAFAERRPPGEAIQLIYLGRLLDSAKGIFQLPKILEILSRGDVRYHLTIVGDGPDRQKLEARLSSFVRSGRVTLMGSRPHGEIPSLLSGMDVLLMPSTFEGFGFSLIEAMAAGVVPIVSRIAGVTDWIVKDGQTGYVCPIGKAAAFADRVAALASDPSRRVAMSSAAHREAKEQFSLSRLGEDYIALFSAVLSEPDPTLPPAPWSEFEACRAFDPTFRRWIPENLRGRLRGILERWRGRH